MRYVLVLALALFLATPAFAAFKGPGAMGNQGGFTGPGATAQAMSVQQAKNLPDDTRVTLTGNIVSQVPGTDDKYIFRDNTGEITVDIDHKRFRGQNVTPSNTVRIAGEVDKDFGRAVEIDVKRLEVIN